MITVKQCQHCTVTVSLITVILLMTRDKQRQQDDDDDDDDETTLTSDVQLTPQHTDHSLQYTHHHHHQ